VLPASFLLLPSAIGEVTAWGGYPQLLGAPLAVCGVWMLDRWLASGERRVLVLAATLGAFLLAVSHFTALLAAAAAGFVIVSRTVVSVGRRMDIFRRTLIGAGVVSALALPLAIVYVRLIPATLSTRVGQAGSGSIVLRQILRRFETIHGAAWPFWLLAFVAAAAGIARPPKSSRDHLWVVNAAFVAGTIAIFLLTRQPRLLYEIPAIGAIGIGLWIRDLVRRDVTPRAVRAVLVMSGVSAFLVVSVIGVQAFPSQRRTYGIVDPGILKALEWVRDETPEGSLVAVTTLDSAPLGWWVEGLGERRVLGASPTLWLTYPVERRLASEADHLFTALERSTQSGMRAAQFENVDYLFLARSSVDYQTIAAAPWFAGQQPAFEDTSAVIIEVQDLEKAS
jgi:hypothetical protein